MKRIPRKAWLVTAVAILLTGCMSVERTAPPVGPKVEALAAQRQVEPAELEHGRELYISHCAECHSLQPVERYSIARWEKIIPSMARKAKLYDADTYAVRSYLLLTRESLETKG